MSGRYAVASPQTEHGFTRLADELLEALIRFDFTKRQYKVLLAVIRKTYGFQKKEDDMTAQQLADMTGLDRANVTRTLNELAKLRVLHKRPGRYGQVLGVNKDYESWQKSRQQRCQIDTGAKTAPTVVPEQHLEVCQNGTAGGAKTTHTIENTPQTLSNRQPPQQTGGSSDWFFPKEMTGPELEQARLLVSRAGEDAQAILDVLAAAINAGEIRKSRLAVLSGLMRRYEQGSFDPAPGLHLAQARERAHARQALEQQRQQAYARQLAESMPVAVGEGKAAFDALVKKMNPRRRR